MTTEGEQLVVIVGCGKVKRNNVQPAWHLYTSGYVKTALKWALSVTTRDRLFILSAKHELIEPTTRIGPYSAAFSGSGHAPKNQTEPTVSREVLGKQLRDFNISGDVITLAGEAYRTELIAASGGTVRPYNPFATYCQARGGDARQGYQMQAMLRHKGRVPTVSS